MRDVLIVGGGPAGLAAALQLAARGRTCTILSGPIEQNPLYRAPRIDNYPGLPGISGAQLLTQMRGQALQSGAEWIEGKVVSLLASGDTVMAATASDTVQGRCLILACGAVRHRALPGEKRLLGHGVSYCATCDGMLYRGRRVVVTGNAPDLRQEAEFLQRIGARVMPVLSPSAAKRYGAPCIAASAVRILGEQRVRAVWADGQEILCDGVFVLNRTVSPGALLPGLETDGAYIRVDRRMRTNLPHVYAAGDCTGAPLQIAKAVGEGLTAATWAAAEWEEENHADGQRSI